MEVKMKSSIGLYLKCLCFCLFACIGLSQHANAQVKNIELHWNSLNAPCDGNCFVSAFAGPFVVSGASELFAGKTTFVTADYDASDILVGGAIGRKAATLFEHFHIEFELGIAQRFGRQEETEFFYAHSLKFDGFPWRKYLYTSISLKGGLSYATDISDIERARSPLEGTNRLLHILAPELTLALPKYPGYEALFRFHHRSGFYGLVSDTEGGAQYMTFGLRKNF